MIICVDCDNILNNLTEAVLALYNSNTGKHIKMSDITSYNFEECLSKEDTDEIIKLFKSKELWDSLTPISGSQKHLKTLANRGHRIIIATATDPVNFEWKCDWIKKYFDFIPADNIIRIIDKGLLKCDVMIDDHIDNLTSSICERICLDYPYNRDESKDYVYDIFRANNWGEITNIINNIERMYKEWEEK